MRIFVLISLTRLYAYGKPGLAFARGQYNTLNLQVALSLVVSCKRTDMFRAQQVNRLAISPDKRFIAAAGAKNVHLYDVQHSGAPTGAQASAGGGSAPIAKFEGHEGNITALAWNIEASWIVTGSEDGTLKIWEVRLASCARKAIRKLNSEQGPVQYNATLIIDHQ